VLSLFQVSILQIFIIVLILLLIFILAKAYYHFKYLKIIYPEKFSDYGNFFDLFNCNEFYNEYRFLLILPFFKKESVFSRSMEI